MSSTETVRRALVIDVNRATSALIRSLLLSNRRISASVADDEDAAWSHLATADPELIFVAHAPPYMDCAAITTRLRFSELASRRRPVIMLAEHPTAQEVRAARDAGVDEVLKKPFTARDLIVHVDVALSKQREWVEGIAYVGPDRRRFNAAEYLGSKKRGSDRTILCPHSERISQALKIMKTAVEALDAKPQQAVRALYAQADEIQEASAALGNHSMGLAAQTLRSYLDTANRGGKFDRAQFKRDMGGMFGADEEPARKTG